MFDISSFETAPLPDNAVEVGRIAEPWGVKGWFKVVPYSNDPQALLQTKHWLLQMIHPPSQGRKEGEAVQLTLCEVRPHTDTLVAHADGVGDRDAAQALRGARIFLARESFPATQEGEYYWVDLIGLEVVNRQGILLGTVRELLPAGPQTTLVLTQGDADKKHERLIPFVATFVDKVDLAARCITVDWQTDY